MNLPNLLTLLRIILVPVIIIFLIQESYKEALLTFVIAGLTDIFDGLLARSLNKQTKLGAFIDPMADKLLLASSFVSLSVIGLIPSWLTVIVISRDFIIVLGMIILSMMSIKYEIKPALISKATTAFQLSTIFFALLDKVIHYDINSQWLIILCWVTAAFTVASGFAYIMRGIKYINHVS
ncbi:MAG TPA: CDP-alcohol phosphatidyltransferase family protein [Smithellaceae bacterium]|jgi:cardiolipin synthase|nr:CDP-alcohol phosphatidyltransferase family protein [Syntrophaceae bacterium]NMD06051.1 CDP-diacylglycerol--glycerol-3-phosphate 3-phosphatidyltransferase [Deltaproteobacteria bacterium]HNZ30835.1 CDP-alcohol phosphatidyltransferase family protein [Smithellaceae bacterium]HQM35187.1 CDP-alcohol phosphatidyltransferase family protein [Candidatus Paceibacterota bacterium]MBP8608013.1 CDP-alcohol phosphatidyltransferase family protein [Syntrophaceae bacterium]